MLAKAEAANPGTVHELIDAILEAEQATGGSAAVVKLLKVSKNELEEYRVEEKTPELAALVEKARALRNVLSIIPDQIEDRTKFLATIRSIAGTIKELLEAVTAVIQKNADLIGGALGELSKQKVTFVRVSKSFSETLKGFFKDGKKDVVLRSAHLLVNQTNLMMRTIKEGLS